MSGVDNRIVSMEFDNAVFERKLAETINSLDKLRSSLDFSNSKRGLDDLKTSTNNFDMSKMAAGVDNISSRFSALGAVGFSVIQGLTQNVLGFVGNIANIAKTDVLGPILTGGKQRALNLEQAQFMFQGLGIDVAKGMKSANDAVLGTAFGLDEAAKAAAQFGASGIKVGDQMTSALRGVAGAAALTGKGFTEIADIFAGSAGSGKVTNQDLLQFSTRGLNAAAAIAPILGTTEQQIHEMARNGDLDFKTFAAAMDKAFGKHATEANKTYTGALANMHAAMSRLGASFFTPELVQQRDLFNTITPVIDGVTKALRPLTDTFISLRRISFDNLIKGIGKIDLTNLKLSIPDFADGFKNAFGVATQYIDIFKLAFRDIFPESSLSLIRTLATAFKNLTENLKMGAETADKVRSIFRGFFAIIEIGWTIIKEIVFLIRDFIGVISPAGAGLLDFSANAGDMATKLNAVLVAGGGIHRFFLKLRDVIASAVGFITTAKDKIVDFFSTVADSKAAEAGVTRVVKRFDNLTSIPDRISAAWQGLHDRFQGVFDILDKVGNGIKQWFSELGQKIADSFHPGDFNNALDVINVGLFGGLIILLKKFFAGGLNIDFGGGLALKISGIFTNLTRTLQKMQANLKADVLLKIAGALGILVVSLVALSLIDSANLTKALIGMEVGFGSLIGTMIAMEKLTGSVKDAAKLAILGVVLGELAVALGVLTIAIAALGRMDIGTLAKGLAGVGVGLAILVVGVNLIKADPTGLIAAGLGMIAISAGLLVLSKAVQSFATISWGDIAKGMVSVAVGLGIISIAMKSMPAKSVISGLGFIEVAAGLLILAQAVKSFASIGWADMAKGMTGIAAGLIIIAIGMNLMPLSLPITAAGLLILSGALVVMAEAVKLMGENDLGSLAKGIGAFAAMLVILSVAMIAMTGTAAGAGALLVTSAALLVLTHVLESLAQLSIAQLATGILAIAVALGVLGGAALVLEPVIPAMLSLGAAIGLIGAGFALFGAGAILVAKAFEALAKAGPAGAKALVEMVKVFVTAKFDIAKALADAVISFAQEILKAVPLLTRLMEAIILQLLQTIIKLTPQIAFAIALIVTDGLQLIRLLFPDIVQTGFDMLIAFLEGVRNNMPEIVQVGVEILVAFVNAIVSNMSTIIGAAFFLLESFLFEVGNHVDMLVAAGFKLLTDFLSGIGNNIIKVVDTVGTIIAKFLEGLGNNVTKITNAGADMLVKFLDGVVTNTQKLIDKGVEVAGALLDAISSGVIKLTNKIGDVLVNFLNGMADAIRTHSPELRDAGINIAGAILDGMTLGLASKAKGVVDTVVGIGKSVIDAGLSVFGINSPSRVFREMGEGIAEGLVLGLDRDTTAHTSAADLAQRVVDNFQSVISQIPDSLAGMDDFNPTITPVLDLTKVQAASGDINKMMKISTITPDVSFDKAKVLQSATDIQPLSVVPAQPVSSDVKFEQNIYAPKALTTNDIYRNTKSQIALAKEELNIA